MNALVDDPSISIAACPMHAATGTRRALQVADELVLPMSKRMLAQYATGDAGQRELRLFYQDKEISFDEPELFRFGETLAKQTRFVAGLATTWGEGLEWARMRELLETLIAEGVLRYADDWAEEDRMIGEEGVQPSPLPPAPSSAPRTWFESEALTAELAGRALEIGYLEMVVPIFRVAHMSLDAEGRQVGEANVFPPALRIEVPMRWRTCIYEGTRYQVDRPMNVTALKSMRAHWGQMMAALLEIRAAYLTRFPEARAGWTIGHLERLSVTVLALPTYLLMRKVNRVANGDLHPALSSLFRVTDGLRMTMHQMLFIPIGEPARSPDEPMTSAEIYAYAERNYTFHSEHGVCAGPRVMVEEFFSVLIDGKTPRGGVPEILDPQVRAALDDLEPVIDYALLGLQVYAAVFSSWPVMTRTYLALHQIAERWAAEGHGPAATLRDQLQSRIERIQQTGYLSTEDRRIDRERVYADMYAQCGLGVTGVRPRPTLNERIALTPLSTCGSISRQVRSTLEQALQIDDGSVPRHLDELQECILGYLRQTQSVLRVAGEAQRDINVLLGRPMPEQPFAVADINTHIRLRGDREKGSPFLLDDMKEMLGLDISVDKGAIEIRQAQMNARS